MIIDKQKLNIITSMLVDLLQGCCNRLQFWQGAPNKLAIKGLYHLKTALQLRMAFKWDVSTKYKKQLVLLPIINRA